MHGIVELHMKKTKLNKIGVVGRANIEARQRIAEIAEEMGLNYCEIGFKGCTVSWPLYPAHRHKRSWYKGNVDSLADPSEWVSACINCHDRIENDPELTEETFKRLRPY